MVTILFILNLSPSDRKAVAFSCLQLYIAKLISGLTVINMSFPASWAHGANFKDVPDVTWEALGKCPSNRNLERTVYSD